jgi:hypothetical protein
MIEKPKHDYLVVMAVGILILAALGAFVLHYGGATSAAGNVVYHPCQKIYQNYLNYDCGLDANNMVCSSIMTEKERYHC